MTYKQFRARMIGLSRMIERARDERRPHAVIARLHDAMFNLIESNPDYLDA